MARTRIEDLPKNVNIAKQEMKSIMGGKTSGVKLFFGTIWNAVGNLVSDVLGEPETGDFSSDDGGEDNPNVAVGVRG